MNSAELARERLKKLQAGSSGKPGERFIEGLYKQAEEDVKLKAEELTKKAEELMSNLRDYETQAPKGEAGPLGDVGPEGPTFLEHSIQATLAERGSRYGDFTDHARICQNLKRVMTSASTESGLQLGWEKLSDTQKQALEVIADKIARILSGDPNYADNWHDIQGYAKLVEDRLPKEGTSE